ncbi:MAG: S9 family peptidase [candidate division Zixibacteria bacterium]|nr:S9 family peptidase [candidate division Zixibacteria bacterium]
MKKMEMVLFTILIMAVGAMVISCDSQKLNVKPPIAKTEAKIDTLFGVELIDNYSWLRDKENPEVIDYLKAENEYTEAIMKHTEDLQKKLYDEMLSHIKETDLSVPVQRDDYFYYYRTEEGQQYHIYCRKKGSLEAEEEILLDVNALAEGKEFMQLGIYEVSPNHKLLAFGADSTGNERYTIRIKSLETGELYPDIIENTGRSVEWANNNKTIFYNITDEAWRPFKLFSHKLGTNPKDDKLIYHEEDEGFFVGVYKSKDLEYLFLHLGSQTTSEIHFLKADNPDGKFRMIHPRQKEMEYWVLHRQGRFYIVTNEDAKNFKLMETSVTRPAKKYWKEVIPNRKDVKLDNIEVFRDYMVIYEREGGLKQIRIKNFNSDNAYHIDFPEPVYTYWSHSNPDFNSQLVRFTYTSLVTPRSVFDFDMKTRERELKKEQEVLGDFDRTRYESNRVFATAEDGTKIPISIVNKKGMKRDGSNPVYLTAYGAYGISSDPYFSSNRLSLLDRGFIYALAHVRGGGEMGRYWYDDGKLLNKKNTFSDLIAVGEHLIAEKYTSNEKMILIGGSAGGLLVGAVVNMRPDLFGAIVGDVPFVDLMNTMLDSSIPLTVIEYDEWGNPNKEEFFNYMLSYSPYDNVEAKDYPHMLIEGGLNDTRVQYWEPAKWTAKLRATNTGDKRLLLKMQMGAGHGGASGRYDYLKEIAFEYAFMLDVLGIRN